MQIKDLWPAILIIIIIAILVPVGLILLDKVKDVSRRSTTVISESVTFAGGSGTPTNTPLETITEVDNLDGNQSLLLTRADFNFTKSTGLVLINATFDDDVYVVNYTYGADTDATTGTGDSITALKAIPSTWLSLIVTIIILAIVLGLIIRSFIVRGR